LTLLLFLIEQVLLLSVAFKDLFARLASREIISYNTVQQQKSIVSHTRMPGLSSSPYLRLSLDQYVVDDSLLWEAINEGEKRSAGL
jgi:hypothetical protein